MLLSINLMLSTVPSINLDPFIELSFMTSPPILKLYNLLISIELSKILLPFMELSCKLSIDVISYQLEL